MALNRRLLQDIVELQTCPYPNIVIYPKNLTGACLLLTPEGQEPLHLTVSFEGRYPLKAPRISIDSKVDHPNVFGSYICASILNTDEGYTPAYTLKGIAIQLLSFFSSERLEQQYGGFAELTGYAQTRRPRLGEQLYTCIVRDDRFTCDECGFGGTPIRGSNLVIVGKKTLPNPLMQKHSDSEQRGTHRRQLPDISETSSQHLEGSSSGKMQEPAIDQAGQENASERVDQDGDTIMAQTSNVSSDVSEPTNPASTGQTLFDRLLALPNEIIMLVLEELDSGSLIAVASLSKRLSDFMDSSDMVRLQELQCFCLKQNFLSTKLGIGVSVGGRGRTATLESEFDLLSQDAFYKFLIRVSIHGIPFSHWLPLPLSQRHWRSVRGDVDKELGKLVHAVPGSSQSNITVLYSFMSDVVVKLSQEAEQHWSRTSAKSTLTHASEKAVDAYFSLFHLLLCLAIEQPQIVHDANSLLSRFTQGHTNKADVPNLGQLMAAVLISDNGLTQDLAIAIVKEAVLRNVVWMLDPSRGAGMAELVYTEPTPVSEYRLQRTFDASKISYRLLMFLALFSRSAKQPGKSIQQICTEMFERHGAPPKGTAESMAAGIRRIRNVSGFGEFFVVMGLERVPDKREWCEFLKGTTDGSVRAGYSRHALSQEKALAVRRLKEPGVEIKKGLRPNIKMSPVDKISWFPGKTRKNGDRR